MEVLRCDDEDIGGWSIAIPPFALAQAAKK